MSENQNIQSEAEIHSRKVTEAVVESIQGPHSAEDDAGTVISHKLSDQIAADKYFRKVAVSENPNPLSGMFAFRISNGNTFDN